MSGLFYFEEGDGRRGGMPRHYDDPLSQAFLGLFVYYYVVPSKYRF